MKTKYTTEFLKIIEGSFSVREALIKLGFKGDGGHKNLRTFIKQKLEIDGTYRGKSAKKEKISLPTKPNNVFFTNGDAKRTTFSVRNALFNRGLKNKQCENCKRTHWEDKFIPLEVHHIDGNKYNNELVNLEILCPNCHYFTDTYKTKNIKKLV